jgi:hypothetical protein
MFGLGTFGSTIGGFPEEMHNVLQNDKYVHLTERNLRDYTLL